MKTDLTLISLALFAGTCCAFAQGTAFTYQGRVTVNGSQANGNFDLQFSLYGTNSGGVALAGPVTNFATLVSNGLFTTAINFGPGAFAGASNWLDIAVRTNGGSGFSELTPRQQLSPVPYAIVAEGLSGSLTGTQVASIGNTNGGTENFFVGPAGNVTTSGSANTANGFGALTNNTSGSYNTANGDLALNDNTSGSYNVANGASALNDNTGGSYNTANGAYALFNNTSGSYNTANGVDALVGNSSGSDNTADGDFSLGENTSGSDNTASGFTALEFCQVGNNNTAIGCSALELLGSGSNNIALGYNSGSAFTANESSNIDIGNIGTAGENSTTRIGTPGVQKATYLAGLCSCLGYDCQQGTGGAPSGHLFNFYWTGTQLQAWVDATDVGVVSLTSDRRLKEDIQPMAGDALARVMALKPSTFKYKSIPGTIFQGDGQIQQEGFIADELQQVIPSAVNGKKDAVTPAGTIQPQTINLMPLVAVLTKAVQEQQQEINDLKEQVKALSVRGAQP